MSSDSDDGNIKQMLQAVDTNLLNNSLFTEKTETIQIQQKSPAKSLRFLEDDLPADWSQISKETQDFMYRKLSEIIAQQIEFSSDVEDPPHKKKKWKSSVKLLSDSQEKVIAYEDIVEEFNGPTKKPEIKRRQVEPEFFTSEEEKLKATAVSTEYMLEGVSTRGWTKPKKGGTIFEYKTGKDGTCHFLEPANEFTVLRKKNTWSEKKIARGFKKK